MDGGSTTRRSDVARVDGRIKLIRCHDIRPLPRWPPPPLLLQAPLFIPCYRTTVSPANKTLLRAQETDRQQTPQPSYKRIFFHDRLASATSSHRSRRTACRKPPPAHSICLFVASAVCGPLASQTPKLEIWDLDDQPAPAHRKKNPRPMETPRRKYISILHPTANTHGVRFLGLSRRCCISRCRRCCRSCWCRCWCRF